LDRKLNISSLCFCSCQVP